MRNVIKTKPINRAKLRLGASSLLASLKRVLFANQRVSYYAKACFIWLITALFVQLQFSLQLSSGEIVAGLMHSYHLHALGASAVASSYYYIYVLFQMPAGLIIDRYGTRKVLSWGCLVCTVGLLLFAWAPTVGIAILSRFLIGAGAAFAFVGSLRIIQCWFPLKHFAFMVGLAESLGMLGSMACGIAVAHMVTFSSWRYAMVILAITAFFITIALVAVVRDKPENAQSLAPRIHLWSEFFGHLRSVFSNRISWYAGLYSGCMFAVVTVFVSLWSIPFFQLNYHITLMKASVISDMVFLGIGIGTPLIGWFDYRVSRRVLLSSCALLTTLLLSVIILMPALNVTLVSILMFFLGLVSSSYMVPFAIVNDLASNSNRSAYTGFINMLSVGVAPFMQPLIGDLIDYLHTTLGYMPLASYQIALLIMPALSLIALIFVKFLPNSKIYSHSKSKLTIQKGYPARSSHG